MPSHSLDVLTRLPTSVPQALVARAESWADGSIAVTPSPSASVILLRESGECLETYLLHRHARMPFAASMVVFPGGRMEEEDRVAGRDPYRVCALRETEEETGVVLDDAELRPWAQWTTPEIEPRRYETHFFVAAMPLDLQARDISGETDRALWTAPGSALRQAERGEIALMPPTVSILLELSDAASISAVLQLAADRVIEPVLPRLMSVNGRWTFEYPLRERRAPT